MKNRAGIPARTADRNDTTMRFYNFPYPIKPQSCTLDIRDVTIINTLEFLEYFFLILAGNTDTMITKIYRKLFFGCLK